MDGLFKPFALNASALVGYQFTSYLSSVVCTIFIGRLGSSLSLASYGMTRTVLSVSFNGFILGVQESLGVVCSRFYGAEQYTDTWRYLWKSLFIAFLLAAGFHVLSFYSAGLLAAAGIEAVVAVACQRVLVRCAISLYFQGANQVINNFLTAQHITKPLFYLNFISIFIVYVFSSFFINYLELAEVGFAYTKLCQDVFNTCYYLSVLVLYVDKAHFEPPSFNSIKTHFWDYLILNIYTTLAFYGELIAFQIGIFYAALLHDVDALATWVTYVSFTSFHFYLAMGFGSTMRNLVGKRVGEYNIEAAKEESIVYFKYISYFATGVMVLQIYYTEEIARIYTSQQTVIDLLKSNINLFTIAVIPTFLGPSINTLYRVVGQEKFMFWVNVVIYPVWVAITSYIFCFGLDLKIYGLNIGHVLTKVLIVVLLAWHLYWNIKWRNLDGSSEENKSLYESLIERSIDLKRPMAESELNNSDRSKPY